MASKKLTPEQIDQLAPMRAAGRSMTVIARRFGCSRGLIEYYCLVLGIEAPRRYRLSPIHTAAVVIERSDGRAMRRFTAAEDAELLRLEAQKLRYSEIARRMGRKRHVVAARLASLARRAERQEAA